jgi:hypothetical protein
MALNGQVNVWVGTFAGGDCAATLEIASRDRYAAAPRRHRRLHRPPLRFRTARSPARSGTRARTACPQPVPVGNCPNPTVGGPPISLASNQFSSSRATR